MAIYLFGRTDREKEDWYGRLITATHKDIGFFSTDSSNPDIKESLADPLIEAAQAELEYLKYMSAYKVKQHNITLNNILSLHLGEDNAIIEIAFS